MALGNEEVLSTTEQAFAELGEGALNDVKTAVTTLKKMKGVGPATATMVLQAKRDEVPFMSDEAMMLVFNCEKVKLKYDLKTCMAYIEKINEIVTELKNGIPVLRRIETNTKNIRHLRSSVLYLQNIF
jgi:endonuclease III